MIRRLLFVFCLIFTLYSSLDAQEVSKRPLSLIPYPATIVEGEGTFVFTEKTTVALEDKALEVMAREFVGLFAKPAGFTPKIKVGGKKGEVLIKKDDTLLEEGYVLTVNPERIVIRAAGERGAYYALQTLRQLLPTDIEGDEYKEGVIWDVPVINVSDEPRFGYRGLMVDVTRHFIPKDHLLRIIDTMGMLKFNKLHLHLTDDNGWRLEIKQYPLLTSIGSKKVRREGLFPERRNARQGEPLVDGGFYTQEDIREIVAYAANRQIEVIPEIAMPGHSNAALAAYPLLACPVIDKYIGVVPGLGADHTRFAYCAGNEDVFTFLQNIIDEVVGLFPSRFIHLGGDAIHNTHWEECPLCRERMKKEHLDDENDLLGYFMRRIDSYVRSKGRKVMGWEEIMEANLSKGAVVFDWHGYGHGATKAGKQGHDFVVVPTGTMYLNHYQGPQWHEPVWAFSGNTTLKDVYQYEPIERYWTMSMRSHLLGIQAALWTEFCESEEAVDLLLYPRLSAVAEAAWSLPIVKRWERFLGMLDIHQERWAAKGIKSSSAIYHVQHEVEPNFGDLKVTLSCISPEVEIRYTTDGSEPHASAWLYRRPWIVKQSQVLKCAAFKDGKQMGQTLVLPIQMNGITGKNMLRSNAVERRLVNGVRGSLKNTDGEWASWTRNDSISLTFDVGSRKKINRVSLGCLNDYGLGIHQPEKVEVWLSDNDVHYSKIAEERFDKEEIFCEGRLVKELDFQFEDVARYVRLVIKGVGKCPEFHVRPGLETQIYLDEVLIE